MNHRVVLLLLLAGSLHAPLLAEDAAEAETEAATQPTGSADTASEPSDARPSGDDFRPTERLRWDQEVDFPTDI